jgi:hypothetical protein
MRVRLPLIAGALAIAPLACGGDRATGPSESDPAAELERAAAELGLAADPSTALAYQTVAAALRGGARPKGVTITVDGTASQWDAFGHEIVFNPPAGEMLPDPPDLPTLRSLLAWQSRDGRFRVIHLVADGETIGRFFPLEPVDPGTPRFPSSLIYSEGRNRLWVGVRGTQNSEAEVSQTPCPARRQPAGPLPAPSCRLATFRFQLSDVEVEHFAFPVTPIAPPLSGGTEKRRLSMAWQQVDGIQLTLDLPVLIPPPLVGQPLP